LLGLLARNLSGQRSEIRSANRRHLLHVSGGRWSEVAAPVESVGLIDEASVGELVVAVAGCVQCCLESGK
jgi:hypothetical protein